MWLISVVLMLYLGVINEVLRGLRFTWPQDKMAAHLTKTSGGRAYFGSPERHGGRS